MAIYIGVSNTARKVKGLYVGVDGVARKVTKGYIGVDGTARTILSAGFCLGNLPVGTLVMLKENGTPKPFYLAKHDYEPGLNGSGRTLMVREHGYPDGFQQYTMWHSKANGTGVGTYDDWNTDYTLSNLNNALTEYKNVFSAAMQAAIGSTTFYYTHSTATNSTPDNNPYVTTLSRPVFQLSVTELFGENFVARGNNQAYCNVEGSMLPIAETLRKIYNPNGEGGWQNGQILTRSVATYGNTSAVWGVTNAAVAFTMGVQKFAWARPSLTLPATVGVDPEPNADGSYNLTLD